MKTQYDVKLLNGSKQEVTYEGIETVTLPAADGSGVKKFTAGEPIDRMGIKPDFTDGDMPFESPEGYVVRSATVLKPEDAEGKIAKGETLMGIAGEYVTPGTSKTVELDFSEAGGGETVILEEQTCTFNLASDGFYEDIVDEVPLVIGEIYTVTWDGTAYECVCQDASVLSESYSAALGNGTNLGMEGHGEPFIICNGSWSGTAVITLVDSEDGITHMVKITQSTTPVQTVTAEGDERWNEVVINKPENLVPENIAKGVEIAGVVGENQGIVYGNVIRRFTASMQLVYLSYASKYFSGTLRIMIPSEATVIRALLAYGSSYGSSVEIPDPDWTGGISWPSIYVSGSWRVFEAVESFTKQYSQEKHVWQGGVEYIEPAQPLCIDTLYGANLCAFHIPAFSAYMSGGYVGGFAENVSCKIGALQIDSYPSAVKNANLFSGISAVKIKSGDIPPSAFDAYNGTIGGVKHNIFAIAAYSPKAIGEYAFSSCIGLKSFYCLGDTVPTLGSSAFVGTPTNKNIFVRASMLEAFQTAADWSKYSSVMVGLTDEQIADLEG